MTVRNFQSVHFLACAAGVVALSYHSINGPENAKTMLHVQQPNEAPIAQFSEDNMPKVPSAVKCIINLACQYFFVITALAITRTANQFGAEWKAAEHLCVSATQTVTICPMLCVLFLGARMRAEQLTAGATDEFMLPSANAQTAMQTAAWSVFIQLIIVFVIPALTGQTQIPMDEDGNVELNKVGGLSPSVQKILTCFRYLTLATLYGSTLFVVYGIHSMIAPVEVFPKGTPPVSSAVSATINLTSQYFIVYLAVVVCRTYVQFQGRYTPTTKKLTSCLQLAQYTVNMAPMLCILFIGARMRALQIDPLKGQPQEYAQTAFFLCAYSVLIQTILVVVLPFTSKDVQCVQGEFEGDVQFVGLNGAGAIFLTLLRYVAIFSLYGGFSAVCYSVFTIGLDGPKAPPPVSPAMSCVMNLTAQYFSVYLVLFIAQSLGNYRDSLGTWYPIIQMIKLMCSNGIATVMYAPMLSVIFIAARMRALQLCKTVDGEIPIGAGPPTWVQELMFAATWSVLIQLTLVIVISIMYTENSGSGATKMDADGNVVFVGKQGNPIMGYILNAARYLGMVAMYGGSVGILIGTMNMAPETVQPYAHSPFVPGMELPRPPAPDEAAATANAAAAAAAGAAAGTSVAGTAPNTAADGSAAAVASGAFVVHKGIF